MASHDIKITMLLPALLLCAVACTSDGENPLVNQDTLQNHRPVKPHMPQPAAGATVPGVDLVLSWECSDPDGDSLSYDIIFGKQSEEKLVVRDHRDKSYNPGGLEPGHFYGWQVIARDQQGSIATSDFWKFKIQ